MKNDPTSRFRLPGKERLRQLADLSARLKQRRRSRFTRFFGARRAVGLAMLAGLIALRIWDPPSVEDLRLRSFDVYQILRPRIPTVKPVVVVDIDEDSLRTLGQWPWPRTLVADLVERLNALGAVAIGLDIIFAEADRLSPSLAVESFRNVDDETKAKLRNLPTNDDVLAGVLKKSRVILGQSGILQTTAPNPQAPVTGMATRGPDPSAFLITFPGLLRNVPALEEGAAGRGLLTIKNERDGIVRGDVRTFVEGDRWKLVLTCSRSDTARIEVDVREENTARTDHPLAPAEIVCGNRVTLPGAFSVSGPPHRVCARIANARDGGTVCITLRPE